MQRSRGKALQAEERVGAKALGQEWVWHVWRRERRPMCVAQSTPAEKHTSAGSLQ